MVNLFANVAFFLMKKITTGFLCFCFFSAVVLKAQQTVFDEVRVLYRSENAGGLLIHTNGFGFNYRKGKILSDTKKMFYEIDIVTLKHPKEIKKFNPYKEDTRGYFYGKKNSVLVIRPNIGYHTTFISKQTAKGVAVSLATHGGLSLAFAKPVYLEIRNWPYDSHELVVEKYDEDKHFVDNIYGRANATKGIEETKIYPGIYGKFGLNFEYAPEQDVVRAMEVGMMFDVYPKALPIMAQKYVKQQNIYFNLYLNFLFGSRKYE